MPPESYLSHPVAVVEPVAVWTSLPVAAATRELVQTAIGHGHTDCDFSVLLRQEAAEAGLDIEPENIEVSDGLAADAAE